MDFVRMPIGKKQVVAATGLFLIGFILAHLLGNFLIFIGPDAFNSYAHKLASLRPALYLVELVLLGIFLLHVHLTSLIVRENIRARGGLKRYVVDRPKGERSLAARLMPYTGTVILVFLACHLLDFTFADHHGSRTVLADGKSYGLYGLVYNSFSSPQHSLLYILAVCALGFHLSHAIQSLFQTFGVNHPFWTLRIRRASYCVGLVVALGYSSIPVFVLLNNLLGSICL